MPHEVFIVDDRHPEDTAMLQALYSRSPASVVKHLETLKKAGSGKFMGQYYVGYGHASIGDCGQTVCFIEQVSMLVAKAVQDHPLYNGQEASTRYLDYSQQAIKDPTKTDEGAHIQERWRQIYQDTLEKLKEALAAQNPYDPALYKTEKVWDNTIKARAFDIARGLLPVGTTTLLSWSTSLRNAREHLRRLKYHPLEEVRDVAQSLFSLLNKRYPHSFLAEDMALEQVNPRDEFAQDNAARTHYQTAADIQRRFQLTDEEKQSLLEGRIVTRRQALDLEGLRDQETNLLAQRPPAAALPWRLESYGKYNFLFLLDFGSFRDIQRHRNGVCQIPLVDGRYGLEPWYQEKLAALLSAEDYVHLNTSIAEQFAAIEAIAHASIYDKQYFYPMGTRVLVHASYSLPEAVYVAELRSGKTVHGSLRRVAHEMLQVLADDIPQIALYGDVDEQDWTAKRGEQTIEEK
ncbi:MAG: FAD-dependent thymidylate synthase [Alphaproteobacteria bacterium]|nr:FAD-dependent thymidylate synthase [Alphaproteobacteria bacterium]